MATIKERAAELAKATEEFLTGFTEVSREAREAWPGVSALYSKLDVLQDSLKNYLEAEDTGPREAPPEGKEGIWIPCDEAFQHALERSALREGLSLGEFCKEACLGAVNNLDRPGGEVAMKMDLTSLTAIRNLSASIDRLSGHKEWIDKINEENQKAIEEADEA